MVINPQISVIVPVFKVENYIEKCVDSLLSQIYDNLEIILVDDGSPDKCPEICDDLTLRNPKVKTFHKTNGGLASARNYGVNKAKGEWIAFVDSDDYVEPTYISDMLALIKSTDSDLAITRVVRESKKSKRKSQINNQFEPYIIKGQDAFYHIYIAKKVGWQAVGKLFKKEALLQNPFPDGYYEDFAVMYRIFEDCNNIVIGDFRNNYHYICREDSILKQKINEKHYHIFELCDELNVYVKNRFPNDVVFGVLLYMHAVLQLLNLTKMNRKTFKTIFNRYKPLFRRNFKFIKNDRRFTRKVKILFAILCTSPVIYKIYMMFKAH